MIKNRYYDKRHDCKTMAVMPPIYDRRFLTGVYNWHTHAEDEFFYVVKGEISIQVKGQPDIVLCEGEMAVVPKGVEHCPKSETDSYVLMFEPNTLKSDG